MNTNQILACSCSELSVCEAFSHADAVFVGTVISTKNETRSVKYQEDEVAFPYKYQVSRFRVEESFFGGNLKEVDVITDLSTSCEWKLSKGTKYLIYGHSSGKNNVFSTGYCSRSTPIGGAKEDLEYLRTLPKEIKGSTLSGNVSLGKFNRWTRLSQDEILQNYKDLLGLGITTLKLQNDFLSFETKIREDGTYKFNDIPKGKYRLQPLLPMEQTTTDRKEFREVELTGHGCEGESFTIIENGQVTGKITDTNGRPVKGIQVSLIPVGINIDSYLLLGYDRSFFTVTTDDEGKFYFKGVSTDNYVVATRATRYVYADSVDAAYPRTFFPSVSNQKDAQTINVVKGKLNSEINFSLAPKFPEQIIKGQVFFKNGRPAPKVYVRYVARTPDRKQNSIIFIKTDEKGYFSFTGYKHRYLIGSFTDERQGNKPVFAIEQEILVNGEMQELKFVLDRKDDMNCKDCRSYSDFPTDVDK